MMNDLTAKDQYTVAQLHFSKRQFNEALDCLKKAYAIEPHDFALNFLIGKTFYAKNDFDRAKKIFSELITREPDLEELKLYLAYCYYKTGSKTGSVDVASNLASEIIKKNPQNIFALELLADTNLYNKDYDDALALYNKIKGGIDNVHRITFKQALCSFYLGDYSESQTLCSQLFDAGYMKSKEIKKLYEASKKKNKEIYLKDYGEMTLAQKLFAWLFDPHADKMLSIQAQANRRVNYVQRKAYSDALTGIKNRACFDETIKPLFTTNQELVLIFCDIDKFKSINDTYGHDKADIALKHYADLGRTIFDNEFYRYGGEEFIGIHRGTKEQAIFLAEKFRKTVEIDLANLTNKDAGLMIPIITCSIGLAAYPLEAKTFEEIISLADKRVYEAKDTGRNKLITDGTGREKLIKASIK